MPQDGVMATSRRRPSPFTLDRFSGHILGVGTTSGRRFVVGVWDRSPFGAFADVMVAHADGRREFLAPNETVAEYVSQTYHFDDVTLVDVAVRRDGGEAFAGAVARSPRGAWSVLTGPRDEPLLALTMTIGARTLLGQPLRFVRGPFVHPLTARLINPVASRVMPGVRTAGTAGNGRREFYLAQDLHRIDAVTGTWRGADVGMLTDVDPEPNFGFSSTPRSPACTTVTTLIQRPA